MITARIYHHRMTFDKLLTQGFIHNFGGVTYKTSYTFTQYMNYTNLGDIRQKLMQACN